MAEPTLREMRATLATIWSEIENRGVKQHDGRLFSRIYDHMSWLLDAWMFDTDPWADDGGRALAAPATEKDGGGDE